MQNEVASVLRLNGWAGRTVLLVYGVGTTIVAALNIGELKTPALGVVALALLWAGLVILGLVQGEPLGLGWTVGIMAIVTATTAISTTNVLHPDDPHYATWPLGAMTFLLFVLALRGRRSYAWIGFVALAIVSIAGALIDNADVVKVIYDVARQSATLLIGTLFAIVLRRATQTITSLHNAQVSRAAVAATSATAARDRDEQNHRLEQDARPALERIIASAPFTTEDLRQFDLLAENLRGGTQESGSGGTPIAAAVRAARVRGLNVTFVDEGGSPLTAEERGQVENALMPLLTELDRGSITVRLSADGSEEIATIVIEQDGVYSRVLVSGTVQPNLA
jgi:hypothetical protein